MKLYRAMLQQISPIYLDGIIGKRTVPSHFALCLPLFFKLSLRLLPLLQQPTFRRYSLLLDVSLFLSRWPVRSPFSSPFQDHGVTTDAIGAAIPFPSFLSSTCFIIRKALKARLWWSCDGEKLIDETCVHPKHGGLLGRCILKNVFTVSVFYERLWGVLER